MGLHVGVVDSGWNAEKDDPRILPGVSVETTEGANFIFCENTNDEIGHGTLVSEIILEHAPMAKIVPIKIFRDRLSTQTSILIAAINWAIMNRLPLVNLSLGTADQDAAAELFEVCARAEQQGTIIVAAARDDALTLPARLSPVVGVRCAEALNYGQLVFCDGGIVDCFAKGVQRRGRHMAGAGRLVAAASYAAPEVTGRIARYFSDGGVRRIAEVRTFLRGEAYRDLRRFSRV